MKKLKKRDNSIDFILFEYNYFNNKLILGLAVVIIAIAILAFFVVTDLPDNGVLYE